MDREDLVTVCTVNNPTEAEIIRAALESAGFACEISGENQGGFAGVFTIDVLTRAADVEAARDYLHQLRDNTEEQAQQTDTSEGLKDAIQEAKPHTDIQPPPQPLP